MGYATEGSRASRRVMEKAGLRCAQFLQNPNQVSRKAFELGIQANSLRGIRRCKRPRPESQRDNPLLRPIVEVA